tara:strand:+ start:992 stop:1192 length:201 start_codon:yes stop_codon:yes gene_type:complete
MEDVIYGAKNYGELNLGEAIMCLKFLVKEYKNGDEEIVEDIITLIDAIEEPVQVDYIPTLTQPAEA